MFLQILLLKKLQVRYYVAFPTTKTKRPATTYQNMEYFKQELWSLKLNFKTI